MDLSSSECKFSIKEVSLYTSHIQYLSTIVNQSYREVVFCSAVCAVLIVIKFLLAGMVSSTVNLISHQSNKIPLEIDHSHANLAANYDMVLDFPIVLATITPKIVEARI
jgi:hypothetical protein